MAKRGKSRKQPPRPAAQPSWEGFAHAMRQLYEEANLTGRQLAPAAKVSDSAISRYLLGQNLPPQRFVDVLVTLGLERLNRNTDYVTVDIDTELRHWQTAWAHVEKALHPTGTRTKVKPPADITPKAESPGGGWHTLRSAAWAIGGALSAFAGARLGSNRPAPHPTRPAPATTTPAVQSSPPSVPSPPPELWRPKPVQIPKATNQPGSSGNTQEVRPTRRRIWTYSDHVRRQQGQ